VAQYAVPAFQPTPGPTKSHMKIMPAFFVANFWFLGRSMIQLRYTLSGLVN